MLTRYNPPMTVSILEMLGLSRGSDARAVSAATGTDTVRRIVSELERLDETQAKFLAGFAYVLSRVAAADHHISDEETEKMVTILCERGHLSDEQAVLVVEIAKTQHKLFGGTEDFLVTREFRAHATDAQRTDLLDCLFALSAVDQMITPDEESQIRQIASELGFDHKAFVEARIAYSSHRSVLRDFRERHR
jgi:uncharacterized tellurite resistance protein B-like protein